MKTRRFLCSSLSLCGLLAPQIAAFAAGPSLIDPRRSRFMRFDGDDTETLDQLKTRHAAAEADRDKFKGDFETTKTERYTHAAKLLEIENSTKTEAQKAIDKAKLDSEARTAAEGFAKEARTQLAVDVTVRA